MTFRKQALRGLLLFRYFVIFFTFSDCIDGRAWWKKFVQENPYNVGLDAAILMNPEVWVASGHVSTFNDPLIDCKACKMRHRADKLVEAYVNENGMDVSSCSF